MKTEYVKTTYGDPVTRLVPENDADRKRLAEAAAAGALDIAGSFGDDEFPDDDEIEELLGF